MKFTISSLSCSGWFRYVKWARLRSTRLKPGEPSGNSKSPHPGLPAWESSEVEAMLPTLSTAHMENNVVQGKSCLNWFIHMAQLVMLWTSKFSWICKLQPKKKKKNSFSFFPFSWHTCTLRNNNDDDDDVKVRERHGSCHNNVNLLNATEHVKMIKMENFMWAFCYNV